MGIEPTLPAWKAGTLPLSYTRKIHGGEGRIRTCVDITSADLQSAAIDRSATSPDSTGILGGILDSTENVNGKCIVMH